MKRAWVQKGIVERKGVSVMIAALIGAIGFVAHPRTAQADDAYCQKVRGRAAADAALLIAPKVLVEGVKVPAALQRGGRLDPTTPGAGYQLRGGLSFSAISAYKGVNVMDVADADCVQHENARTATELLLQAPELGRLDALRKQAQYLDSQKSVIDDLITKMGERRNVQAITVIELEDIRARASLITRARMQISGEIARLEASGIEPYRGSVSELVRRIESSTMRFEREVSHLRTLDAWDVSITGGYIPDVLSQGSQDFFGVVQISYSLGGPWHSAGETRYLDARQEEVRKGRYELRRQLEIMRAKVKAAVDSAKSEIELLDKRIAEMRAYRATLENAEASSAPHVRARLELEIVAIESDRVFLVELAQGLSRLEMDK